RRIAAVPAAELTQQRISVPTAVKARIAARVLTGSRSAPRFETDSESHAGSRGDRNASEDSVPETGSRGAS
ncbi:MAG: hypothetical protein L0G85_09475, partial [Kocuria sp.]|nr:hypothetical protein [Kocuria sp.]